MKSFLAYTRMFSRVSMMPAAAALLLSFSSCSKYDSDVAVPDQAEIELSGTVYDDLTRIGIHNMRVILSEYERRDRGFEKPVQSDTAYTIHNGSFILKMPVRPGNQRYRLEVDDIDKGMNGAYESSRIKLNIDFNSPAFDPKSATLYIRDFQVPVSAVGK